MKPPRVAKHPASDSGTESPVEQSAISESLDAEKSAGEPSSSPPAKSKSEADDEMALYEEHLKENDWGHQPC